MALLIKLDKNLYCSILVESKGDESSEIAYSRIEHEKIYTD